MIAAAAERASPAGRPDDDHAEPDRRDVGVDPDGAASRDGDQSVD
jgi:hypothetical protein